MVITTCDEKAFQNPCTDDPMVKTDYPLCPFNHEEFDTRVMQHVTIVVSQGYRHILIIANDTDIIVLALSTVRVHQLWMHNKLYRKVLMLKERPCVCSQMQMWSKLLWTTESYTNTICHLRL